MGNKEDTNLVQLFFWLVVNPGVVLTGDIEVVMSVTSKLDGLTFPSGDG